MIYWTKPVLVFDKDEGRYINTGELEEIKESSEPFVPDGDGFEVDMNGIKYKSYLKKPDKYKIEGGKLVEVSEESED